MGKEELKMEKEAKELRKLATSKLQQAREEKDSKKRIQLLKETHQVSLEALALEGWMKYHTSAKYQKIILEKFGEEAYNDVVASTKIKLKRKILGD